MLKLSKDKISLFLIVIAMFLLIVSSGNCEAKYKFNMAGPEPLWGSLGLVMQAFASGVRHLSGGDIDITIFPAGEWGENDNECLQSIQLGNLDLMTTVSTINSQYTDALYMFDTPFLFKDLLDEISFTFESPMIKHTPLVTKVLEEASKEAGFMILSVAPGTTRNIFSNKPIESIDDIKGMKIRTPANPIQVDAYNFAGLIATPLPYQEVFTALQLKNIDAAENSPGSYIIMKFYEAAPYFYESGFYYASVSVMMSMKAWNSLPIAYQNIVRECAVGSMYVFSMGSLGLDKYSTHVIEDKLAKKVTTIKPEEKLQLRKTVLPKLLDKYAGKIGMEVLEILAEDDEVITNWLEKNK